jgi:hypothetical protein
MKTLAVTVAALALLGVTGANAQDYPYPYAGSYVAAPVVAVPAPAYTYGGLYLAAPVGVAPAPIGVAPPPYGSSYVPGPYPGSYVVDAYTGRWCTFQPDGWHWCWTP